MALPIIAGIAGCNEFRRGDPDGTVTLERTQTVTPTTALYPTSSPASPIEPPTDADPRTSTTTPSTTPTSTIAEDVGTPALTYGSAGVYEFGRAVALSNEAAIVVAEDHGAYVFEAGNGWSRTAVLLPEDSDDFGGYNVSAALVGEVAMVGGPGAGTEPDTGAVYLFERVGGEWTQRHRFSLDDGESDEFGRSVAFDGDRVVVGDAHNPGTMVPWIGGAYVFAGDGTNWTREANLETDAQDLFGTAVAVDDETVLVGAPYATPGEEQTGAVYAFERVNEQWQRQTVLAPEDSDEVGLFGQSVALDRGTAVIGSPGTGGGKGSAYVFEQSGREWIQRARVTAPGAGPEDAFGQSVALGGGIAVVGAPEANETGRAYVFRAQDGWAGSLRLVPRDPHEDAAFGSAVALSASTALVGSPVFNATSAAYLFDL